MTSDCLTISPAYRTPKCGHKVAFTCCSITVSVAKGWSLNLFQYDKSPVHKARSMKHGLPKVERKNLSSSEP